MMVVTATICVSIGISVGQEIKHIPQNPQNNQPLMITSNWEINNNNWTFLLLYNNVIASKSTEQCSREQTKQLMLKAHFFFEVRTEMLMGNWLCNNRSSYGVLSFSKFNSFYLLFGICTYGRSEQSEYCLFFFRRKRRHSIFESYFKKKIMNHSFLPRNEKKKNYQQKSHHNTHTIANAQSVATNTHTHILAKHSSVEFIFGGFVIEMLILTNRQHWPPDRTDNADIAKISISWP